MSAEPNRFANNLLDELDDPRLLQAVEHVRRNTMPEDSLRRSLERAHKLTSTAFAIRSQPTVLKPAPQRLAQVAVAVGVVWIIAAMGLSLVDLASDQREAARRSTVKNNLKQIGMAFHNYSAGEGRESNVATLESSESMTYGDVDELFGITGGTSKQYPNPNYTGINGVLGMDGGGVFPDDGKVRIRDVHDGLSNTFMIGEQISQTTGKSDSSQKKIIQTADVALVVKELAAVDAKLAELVQKHHAEISNSQIAQAQGQQRAARWILRVPPASVDGLLRDLAALGSVEVRSIGARDVTEEYIDLEAQIKNKKQLEQRILTLLEKQTGNIKDVLAVEEQLGRIRTEIESMEGRKKYLDSVTAMATVTVVAREQAEYVPPEVDTFFSQVGRSWSGSLDLVQNFGKSLVLVAVSAGPWIPIIGVAGFVMLRLWRRWRTRVA